MIEDKEKLLDFIGKWLQIEKYYKVTISVADIFNENWEKSEITIDYLENGMRYSSKSFKYDLHIPEWLGAPPSTIPGCENYDQSHQFNNKEELGEYGNPITFLRVNNSNCCEYECYYENDKFNLEYSNYDNCYFYYTFTKKEQIDA